MTLNKTDWKVRLFLWSLEVRNEFIYDWREYRFKKGTNLCHFVRVICFYMPLIFLLHLVLLAEAVVVGVVLPIYFFGLTAYAFTVGGIAALVLTIWGLTRLARKAKRQEEAVVEPPVHIPVKVEKVKVEKGPSVWAILAAYLKAAKEKVCPLISFDNIGEVAHD